VTVTPDTVLEALAPLRQGFNADGADLCVDEASSDRVSVRLVLTDETCMDCISPTPVLTRIVETTLRS
jgi:hypothetical protein